jgi:Acetyltransferase (GNAT) domain
VSYDFLPYTRADAARWNALVARSANATFLFDRGFMDYHADRFTDASLLVLRQDKLVALLPAHREGARLISHGGLSYGGLVVDQPLGTEAMLQLMQDLQAHLAAQGITELLYKTIPHLYHQRPCEADRYALFRCGARLVRRDVLSAIGPTPAHWPPAQRRQVTGAMRARVDFALIRHDGCAGAAPQPAGDVPVAASAASASEGSILADWTDFWTLLEAELAARHESAPVHSLAEITRLAAAFPQHIRLHLARRGSEVLAGMVLFETATASHVQYMAASPASRRCAALDLLAERAIAEAQASGKWFDFGHSNEEQGQVLNTGLAFYKESHGASAVAHDYYLLPCPLSPHAPTLPE